MNAVITTVVGAVEEEVAGKVPQKGSLKVIAPRLIMALMVLK